MNTSVCIEGCEAGFVGQHCNITKYNLATNGIATQSPSNRNHPAYLSVNGNRTGMCSMTSGTNSYIQVDTGYISTITMIYITFGEFSPVTNMTYSVYCSNTSDSWNNGTELYNGEHPMDNIYVTVVCRYVIYVPPIINRTSKVDVCEIEISGCPLGKYGDNCKMSCSENCKLGSCDLVGGNCTYGCSDGWVSDRCNETCSEGWFGNQCLNKCSPHCFMTSCDHVMGECIHGCNKGWTDYNCTEACDNSYYGYNCTEKCNCLISTVPCNKSTGMCPGGKCEKGWSGESCKEGW
ncbi:Hypothetical predicted protein [Mytilus galloprovincialis]|uniref:Uncharacterized protein n=1 Tax=Mytilus galloprovincialis TaxID=29158 RepID=A0A8B6CY61_MYTGA|nr:Hypothetical predicted protein [Mytilus galloprovincialis]